jgi:myosin heavy subunit
VWIDAMAEMEKVREATQKLNSHSRRLQFATSRLNVVRHMRAAQQTQLRGSHQHDTHHPQPEHRQQLRRDEEEDVNGRLLAVGASGDEKREMERLRLDRALLMRREQHSMAQLAFKDDKERLHVAGRERALQKRLESFIASAAGDDTRLRQHEKELRRLQDHFEHEQKQWESEKAALEGEKEEWRQRWQNLLSQCRPVPNTASQDESTGSAAALSAVSSAVDVAITSGDGSLSASTSRLASLASLSRQLLEDDGDDP